MKRTILAILALVAAPAFADNVWVTEFVGAQATNVRYQAAQAPAITSQKVAISASSAQSAALNSATGLVRVTCDVACYVEMGTNPTATTSSMRLAAGQTEYFVIAPGAKVAALKE